jgi:hypothetical protein
VEAAVVIEEACPTFIVSFYQNVDSNCEATNLDIPHYIIPDPFLYDKVYTADKLLSFLNQLSCPCKLVFLQYKFIT